jgi:hypothetical protein
MRSASHSFELGYRSQADLENDCKDSERSHTLSSFLEMQESSHEAKGHPMKTRIAGILALIVLIGGLVQAGPITGKFAIKSPTAVAGKSFCGPLGCR